MKPNVCRYGGTGHVYVNISSQKVIVWACRWCKKPMPMVKP